MSGLPGSGKSTESKEMVEKYGNTIRVNKDLLRTMLHHDVFTGKNEELTQNAARLLAVYFLQEGVNVVIDETNLNPKTLEKWKEVGKDFATKIEYHNVDTDIETCLSRDYKREKKVGRSVILKMALQYKKLWKGENVVICDLDGTLCDITHRLGHVQGEKKDWKTFFSLLSQDSLRKDVRQQMWDIVQETGFEAKVRTKIIFVSARPEKYRKDTEEWLEKIYRGPYDLLIMRNDGDSRDDTIVKSEIHDKYLKGLTIKAIFDDRPKVIRMWREKGLNVIDVGNGIEF